MKTALLSAMVIAATIATGRGMAHAAGAETYPTLKSLQKTGFYRLTCSSRTTAPQIHAYFEVNQGKVEAVQLISIYPALSLNIIRFTAKDLSGIKQQLNGRELTIAGERPGAYFPERLDLKVRDGRKGLAGELHYDDGDGVAFTRAVDCGAVNYILMPNR